VAGIRISVSIWPSWITLCAPHSTHTLAPATVAALEHQAAELGLTIDAAVRVARQRAQGVANTPMMRAAIVDVDLIVDGTPTASLPSTSTTEVKVKAQVDVHRAVA